MSTSGHGHGHDHAHDHRPDVVAAAAGEHVHHHHARHDHHAHHHGAAGRLGQAFTLNLGFTLVELVGAWWTGSTAIAADAVHDLGDTAALALAWGLEGLSRRPGDPVWSFGFRRLTLVGAVVNALVLLVGGAVVLTEAVPRLFDPRPADPVGMLGLAVLGVVVNGVAAWRASHGHTLNEQVVTWHLLEDVLGWVAVLVGSVVMLVVDLPWLDPALAVGITLFIVQGTLRRLWASLRLLLQATPPDVDLQAVAHAMEEVPGVIAARHVHVWSQDGAFHVLTARLDVDGALTVAQVEVVRDAAAAAVERFGVVHSTLEVRAAGAAPEPCPASR